jgi:aspartyl-tRNA(Asn)/glutamyl-tRNA(Gln) amidotransferase subunit A
VTTAGCSLLSENIAGRDCAAVRRLSAAGMVLLGKTHTVPFAYGGVGINTDMGTPHNPWSVEHCAPGGSSSGSAVATAARMAPVTLGTDTGGSVRIPSALCGVTGLKTTVGQVSRAGVWPLSHSLDSVGPLARSIADCALVYEALQGADPDDESTVGRGPHRVQHALHGGLTGLRLRIPEQLFFDEADAEVVRVFEAAIATLAGAHADIDRIEFPLAAEAHRLNPRGLVIAAEAYHHNRRLLEQNFEQLDPLVATRMKHGSAVPAMDYVATTLAWRRLRAACTEALADVDALLVPTTAIPALPIAGLADDLEGYTRRHLLYVRNTSIGNILDLCAVSVPCGFTSAGMPVGLMVYAKPFCEHTALRVGHAFQQLTSWHTCVPDLAWAMP